MGRHIGITEREKTILELLCKYEGKNYGNIVSLTAMDLNLAQQSIYSMLYRLRDRYQKSRRFGKEYRRWRRRLGKFL